MKRLAAALVLLFVTPALPAPSPAIYEGCDAPVDLPGYPGWKVYECAHPFASRSPDAGPRGACGFEMPSQWKGYPRLPCGFTDAVTYCDSKEVFLWWFRRAGAGAHEMEHVRACPR